jgi:hypothetical protein
MIDIAVQMAVLAQCAFEGVPTNIEEQMGKDAIDAEVIKNLVRV